MFERIKKALSREAPPADSGPPSQVTYGPVSEWAVQHGFGSSLQPDGHTVVINGSVSGKPWRMEVGNPTRNYIRGDEMRARADLGLHEELAVLVMNRPLKEALERKAYSLITDGTHTTAEPNLPEEMRWLAMFQEVGWDGLPPQFWSRYAVLTGRREHALEWIDPTLARLMLDWPMPAPGAEVPFLMIILRGKAYLRMEYTPAEMSTLNHAVQVFTAACESAMGGFSAHVDL